MKFLPLLLLSILLSCKSDLTTPDKPCFLRTQYAAGNSFTAGPGAISYPIQLGVLLNQDKMTVGGFEGVHQLHLENNSVINGGVSGATSTEIADSYLADPRRFGRSLIIEAGRNNAWEQDKIIADIDRMIEGREDYVVLEILNGTWVSEQKGTPYYNNLAELNLRLAIKHKQHFISIKPYLQSFSLPSDLIYIERDQVPQSLLIDSLHLNTTGYKHYAEAIAKAVRVCDNTSNL